MRQGEGDDEVWPKAQRESGERAGDQCAAHDAAPPFVGVDRRCDVVGAHCEDQAPEAKRDTALPSHCRQADRCHHDDGAHQRTHGGGGASPHSGERVDAEDDPEVLQQSKGALAGEAVAEHAVPTNESVE